MVSCEAAMHCDTMPQPATHDADRHATMTSSAAAVLTLQSLLRTEASEQMPCRVGCRRCRAAHAVLTHTSNTNAMPEGPADHGGDVTHAVHQKQFVPVAHSVLRSERNGIFALSPT